MKGDTKITITSGEGIAICNVSVLTHINYIPEPNLEFGESMSTIKASIEADGEIITDDDILAQIRKVDGSNFIYMYLFEDDKLMTSGFTFSLASKTRGIITDFLFERYITLTAIGTYQYAFMSPDEKTLVALAISDDSISVIYMPFERTRSRTSVIENKYQSTIHDMLLKFKEKDI